MSVLCSGSYVVDFIVPDLPEIGAPGSLVYAPRGIHLSPGGHSANVALDLVQLGHEEVHSTGCVGDDPVGELIVTLLRGHGVQVHPQVAEGVATAKNIALIVRGQDRRFIAELAANALLEPEHVEALIRGLKPRVFYQGTVGGLRLIDPCLGEVLDAARAARSMTLVDAIPPTGGWGSLMDALPGVDVFHCNLREARSMLGVDEPRGLLGELVARGVRLATVSDGAGGLYASTGSLFAHMPAFRVEEVDSTGAGDALCAGLVKALIDDGASPGHLGALEAGRLTALMLRGQAAGAACVTGVGATTGVTWQRVASLIRGQAERLLESTTVEEA
jgi:sugar/nucleoside kinase (ribokinase family)